MESNIVDAFKRYVEVNNEAIAQLISNNNRMVKRLEAIAQLSTKEEEK